MIIDFHTHVFPDKISNRAIKSLEQNIIDMQGKSYPAKSDGTLNKLVEYMGTNHVDYSVVLPIATTVKQSISINKFAQEITGKNGIISFGSVHPMQDDYDKVLYEIKKAGLMGIKLHPEYQNVFVSSPEVERVLKKAEELGLYVVFHAGQDLGMPKPIHSMPECLNHILDVVSGDKIIAAHMGGLNEWDDVEKFLVGTPIMLDTSYTSRLMKKEQFKRIVENHGSEKILFGSDSPWELTVETKAYIDSMNLSCEQLDNIYYKNAVKILGI